MFVFFWSVIFLIVFFLLIRILLALQDILSDVCRPVGGFIYDYNADPTCKDVRDEFSAAFDVMVLEIKRYDWVSLINIW